MSEDRTGKVRRRLRQLKVRRSVCYECGSARRKRHWSTATHVATPATLEIQFAVWDIYKLMEVSVG
jgi:hypothetical protein